MTPRDQIQEHAQIAAAKVREAMAEFHRATGMRSSIDVHWVEVRLFASKAPRYLLEDVRLCIQDEAMG
ncbi:hypothetical protein CCO03_08680 [Comamonas serinivorans]|uniref:Uncharacterized protein n=1 Tax=Comamonas serinivorans TaxID=1082851 RepID=A0A1Y0EN49_9BURK|nr:hypothetical protein [Comamonas serinivorans]ARU04742.1 hypothetical protein CCO03_08680 [Comamonas serinivorans]